MQAEADPSDHAALLTCHQSQTTEHPEISMNLSNRGVATTIGGFNIVIGNSQTKGGIHMFLKLHQIMLIMIPFL